MILGKIKEYIEVKRFLRRAELSAKAGPFVREAELKCEREMREREQMLLNGCMLYDDPKEISIEPIEKDADLLKALSVVSEHFRLREGKNIPQRDLLNILFAVYEATGDELHSAYMGETLPPAHWRIQRKVKVRINFDSCNREKGSPNFYYSTDVVLFCK